MAKNNFNDLKETLLGTFNFMAEKVLDLADTAADTAKIRSSDCKAVPGEEKRGIRNGNRLQPAGQAVL